MAITQTSHCEIISQAHEFFITLDGKERFKDTHQTTILLFMATTQAWHCFIKSQDYEFV